MPRARGRSLLAFAGVALALAAAFYFWRVARRDRVAAQAVAVEPDLAGAHPELVARVQEARRDAQAGRRAAGALAMLAGLYYANGQPEACARVVAALVDLEPREPRWPYVLGLLRANGGQLEEALPWLQRALALAPDYQPARLRTLAVLAKLNRTDEAVALGREVLAREPQNIYAWVALGNIQLAARKWDDARASFQQAVSFSAQFRPAWLGLVAVAEGLGDAAAAGEARAQVESVSRSPDSPDPWIDAWQEENYDAYALRVAAFSNPDYQAARRLLERAGQLQPGDAAVLRDYGLLLFRGEDYAGAQQQLLRATALAPADSENWLGLITVLRAMRDEAALARAIQEGLAHCPQSSGLWLEQGRWLQRQRALPAALQALARATELAPQDAAPLVERAVVRFQTGQSDEGLADLRRALALQPDHPFGQMMMTRFSIMEGDQATAAKFLRLARQNPAVLATDKSELEAAYRAQFGAPLPR